MNCPSFIARCATEHVSASRSRVASEAFRARTFAGVHLEGTRRSGSCWVLPRGPDDSLAIHLFDGDGHEPAPGVLRQEGRQGDFPSRTWLAIEQALDDIALDELSAVAAGRPEGGGGDAIDLSQAAECGFVSMAMASLVKTSVLSRLLQSIPGLVLDVGADRAEHGARVGGNRECRGRGIGVDGVAAPQGHVVAVRQESCLGQALTRRLEDAGFAHAVVADEASARAFFTASTNS